MKERKQIILRAIVQSYIATAEPVGSRTIARIYDLGISPATIRNEMQDLEWMGYLEQPHTSAGRIPSLKGYRFYVDSLMQPGEVSREEATAIKDWFTFENTQTQEIFSEAARILSGLTHNLSLAVTDESQHAVFNYIQFLPLDDNRAILLLVTTDGSVDHSTFTMPAGVTLLKMQDFAVQLNRALHGRELREITTELMQELQQDFWVEPQVMFNTLDTIQNTVGKNREIFTDGVSELIRQPEFKDLGKLQELMQLLEESKQLADLISYSPSTALTVRIGPETGIAALHNYSVVQAQFFDQQKLVGSVAVIGPTRMEYDKIVSLLHMMQQKVNSVLRTGKTDGDEVH